MNKLKRTKKNISLSFDQWLPWVANHSDYSHQDNYSKNEESLTPLRS